MAFKLLLILIALAMTVSCRPVRLQDTTESETIIRERDRDTTIYLTDSSSVIALLECDSLGNVLMAELIEAKAGRHLSVPVVETTGHNKPDPGGPRQTILKIGCEVDSAAVYLSWKERDTSRSVVKTIHQPPIEIKRPWNAWQRSQLWAGRIALIMFGVIIIRKFKLLKIF